MLSSSILNKLIAILIYTVEIILIMVILYFIFVYLSVGLFIITGSSYLIRANFWLDSHDQFFKILLNVIFFSFLVGLAGYLKFDKKWELVWLINLIIISTLVWLVFFNLVLKAIF